MKAASFALAALLALAAPLRAQVPAEGTELRHVLDEFAGHYPNELAVCINADGSWFLPRTATAVRFGVKTESCGRVETALHTHPVALLGNNRWRVWFYNVTGRTPQDSRDLCYLNRTDATWFLGREEAKYLVVGVAPKVYCWWTRPQVELLLRSPDWMLLFPIPYQHTWPYSTDWPPQQ